MSSADDFQADYLTERTEGHVAQPVSWFARQIACAIALIRFGPWRHYTEARPTSNAIDANAFGGFWKIRSS